MTLPFPSSDDKPLWDLHLSGFAVPAITVADELGIFDKLATAPAAPAELAARSQLNERALRALLPMLATAGLLTQRLGRYHVTETTRNFLLTDSPYYWGPVLAVFRTFPLSHQTVLHALQAPAASSHWDTMDFSKPSNVWSEGSVPPEVARMIANYMNANSLSAATVAAQRVDLGKSRRLLDVGAGSGCFSIAFARENPSLHCTLMDLQTMCDVAMDFARAAGVQSQLSPAVVDMFRQDWPREHDALFFSNIFHDWDFATCKALAAKAYAALPPGGRILVHEMLLDDTRDGPATAVAFSMYMLLGTKGQQFSATELVELLTGAGFKRPTISPAHGYYSVVSAEKTAA